MGSDPKYTDTLPENQSNLNFATSVMTDRIRIGILTLHIPFPSKSSFFTGLDSRSFAALWVSFCLPQDFLAFKLFHLPHKPGFWILHKHIR